MSLTFDDFVRGIRVLSGTDPDEASRRERFFRFAVEAGHVDIRFEEKEPAVLGGLLALPRAHVTLSFYGVEPGQVAAFVSKFDLAFQRGGG